MPHPPHLLVPERAPAPPIVHTVGGEGQCLDKRGGFAAINNNLARGGRIPLPKHKCDSNHVFTRLRNQPEDYIDMGGQRSIGLWKPGVHLLGQDRTEEAYGEADVQYLRDPGVRADHQADDHWDVWRVWDVYESSHAFGGTRPADKPEPVQSRGMAQNQYRF